jgi:hypothetical protein
MAQYLLLPAMFHGVQLIRAAQHLHNLWSNINNRRFNS